MKTASSDQNDLAAPKQPLNFWVFAAITLIGPATLIGLSFLFFLRPSSEANISLGDALALMFVVNAVRYLLFAIVIAASTFGVIYALRRARGRVAYLVAPLVIPVAYLAVLIAASIGDALYKAHPDYERYQQNVSMCEQLNVEGSQVVYISEPLFNAEVMEKVDSDPAPINTRLAESASYATSVWSTDGPCGDKHMSNEELEELNAQYEKLQSAQREFGAYRATYGSIATVQALRTVRTLEQTQGVEAALEYANARLQLGWTGIKGCVIASGECTIRWVRQTTGEEKPSTQALIEWYEGSTRNE